MDSASHPLNNWSLINNLQKVIFLLTVWIDDDDDNFDKNNNFDSDNKDNDDYYPLPNYSSPFHEIAIIYVTLLAHIFLHWLFFSLTVSAI